MDFAQLRTVKAALVAMCALALLVSGCAAPKSGERQRTATLSGTVSDVNGNPIQGARVAAAFPGGTSFATPVAVTDANGQFTLIDLPLVSPALATTVSASAPGFITATGTRNVGGVVTRLIPITQESTTGVTIVLQRGGASTVIGASGGTVTAAVPAGILPGNRVVTVSFPAGALELPTEITVNPVSASELAEAPPASSTGGAPNTLTTDLTTGAVTVGGVAGAVQILPSGLTFPAGDQPIINLPLPFTLGELPAGTKVPVLTFNGTAWVQAAIATIVADSANPGLAVAQFTISHTTDYIVTCTVTLTAGTAANIQHLDFPPVTTHPEGYTVALPATLVWSDATSDLQVALLDNAFESTGVPANFIQLVTIPGFQDNLRFGASADQKQWSETARVVMKDNAGATLVDITRHGTRTRFFATIVTTLTPVTTLPSHLQGHLQGGGTGG